MSEKPAGTVVRYAGESTRQAKEGELFVIVAYTRKDACLGRLRPNKGWTYEKLMDGLVTHLHVAPCYLWLFQEVRDGGSEEDG